MGRFSLLFHDNWLCEKQRESPQLLLCPLLLPSLRFRSRGLIKRRFFLSFRDESPIRLPPLIRFSLRPFAPFLESRTPFDGFLFLPQRTASTCSFSMKSLFTLTFLSPECVFSLFSPGPLSFWLPTPQVDSLYLLPWRVGLLVFPSCLPVGPDN